MDPSQNKKKAQGAKTREDCITAAIQVFARKGFHRAKLDDIADAAGVTRGALYWHYRTKEAFLIAVLERFTAIWSPEKLVNFPMVGRADLLISRYFKRSARDNRRAPWVNRLGLIVALDAENIHTRVGEIIAEIEETNRWFYASLVKYGQRTDIFDSCLDSNEAGALLATAYTGILASWYQDPRGYDLERLTDSMVRVVLNGLMVANRCEAGSKRAPLGEIRKIDKELDRFFTSQGSAFAYATKATAQS
jgi:AcrR family transcriptional regulator